MAWSGAVVNVSEATFGGGYDVTVRMDPSDSLSADVILHVPASLHEKILSLNKGNRVAFTGRISSQGGLFSYHTVDVRAIEATSK